MSELTELERAALAVLEFYADPDNYAFNSSGEIGPNVILDGGSKARMILNDWADLFERPIEAMTPAELADYELKAARAAQGRTA